jgi:hypothetical protein
VGRIELIISYPNITIARGKRPVRFDGELRRLISKRKENLRLGLRRFQRRFTKQGVV